MFELWHLVRLQFYNKWFDLSPSTEFWILDSPSLSLAQWTERESLSWNKAPHSTVSTGIHRHTTTCCKCQHPHELLKNSCKAVLFDVLDKSCVWTTSFSLVSRKGLQLTQVALSTETDTRSINSTFWEPGQFASKVATELKGATSHLQTYIFCDSCSFCHSCQVRPKSFWLSGLKICSHVDLFQLGMTLKGLWLALSLLGHPTLVRASNSNGLRPQVDCIHYVTVLQNSTLSMVHMDNLSTTTMIITITMFLYCHVWSQDLF